MQTDLASVVDALSEVHPATVDGLAAEQASAIDRAAAELTAQLPLSSYRALLSQVLASMGDGASRLAVPRELRAPVFPLVWLADGLYVYADVPGDRPATSRRPIGAAAAAVHRTGSSAPERDQSPAGLREGDKILSIGGVSVDGLADVLGRFVLGGPTRTAVRSDGVDLVFSDLLLMNVGIDPSLSHVSVEVVRGEEILQPAIRRVTDEGRLVPSYSDVPSYAVVEGSRHRFPRAADHLTAPEVRILPASDVAYIRFDRCRVGDEYNEALRELFTATTMERLSAVIVDLRFNVGGDPRVLNEFLRYLGVREYQSYGTVTRFSPAAAKQFGHRRTEGGDVLRDPVVSLDRLQYPSLVFNGQVYVLISEHTAGAAARFASVIKDQELGLLIGEQTGTSYAGFGDAVNLETPSLAIGFSVPHRLFISPTGDRGTYSGTVSPDVSVTTTIGDVLSGFDRQVAYAVRRAGRGR